MRKTLTILLLLITQAQILFSQKVYDVKADLIFANNGRIELYKKSSNGKFREIEFGINSLYDNEYSFNVYSDFIDSATIKEKSLIEVSTLPDYKNNNLVEELKIKSFYKRVESKYVRGGFFIERLEYFNEVYFTLRTYRLEDYYNDDVDKREERWKLYETNFFAYFLLRVNQRKRIIILVDTENNFRGSIEGFILPKNNSFIASIFHGTIKENNAKSINDQFAIEQESVGFNYNFQNVELYRVEDGNKVKDLIFNLSLIENKFDTVFINNNFIVGKHQNKPSLYNLRLENITPVNTRGIQSGSNGRYCQVLVNNKIFWLNESGKLSKDKVEDTYFICGTVTSINQHITKNKTEYLLEESIDNFDGKDPFLKFYSLFPNNTYDTLLFLNGTEQLEFDGNSGIGASFYLSGNPYNYMIVKKNNKYGLIEIETLSDEPTFSIKLPADYDFIEMSSYYLPVLIKRDNLLGYYPLNAKPKYKNLSKFQGSYARFTLPNNKKGWLSLDGVEFLDE